MPKTPWKYAAQRPSRAAEVAAQFDRNTLARICEMHELEFGAAFGMETVANLPTGKFGPRDEDYYFFKDNGSKILAVAHLDTVGQHHERTANFVDTADGLVIFSRALDDRLGAYTILDLLPRLGVNVDVLLTVGEESGSSTAQHFVPPSGKEYHWIIEFDRGGTDVVMYQYEDDDTERLVREAGAPVGSGSFSDIAYLEHLEVKAFNWGIGYGGEYHGPRAHAFLNDTFKMVGKFLDFHDANADTYLPHEMEPYNPYVGLGWGDGEYYGGSRSGLGTGWISALADTDPSDDDLAEFGLTRQDLIDDGFLDDYDEPEYDDAAYLAEHTSGDPELDSSIAEWALPGRTYASREVDEGDHSEDHEDAAHLSSLDR